MVENAGLNRQFEVYLNGVAGQKPGVPVDLKSLEAKAREVMTAEAYAYVAGGAGQEATIGANRRDFDRWAILPRMLNDVSERDPSVELFGRRLPSPFLVAPIGVQELAHPDADLATAKAAAALGVPMIFSNQASVPMEACAAAMGDSPRYFQLYWGKNRDLVKSLVQRAEKCGCDGIIVTLDTTMLGWRCRDLDLGYLPFIHGKGIAQYTSDPVFCGTLSAQPDEDISPAVQQFLGTYTNPALTWSDLDFLREVTDLPVILKGILHPDDAARAVEAGLDAVYVSNHGGRQVDGSVSAVVALPGVAQAVAGRIPVFFDSGIRSGADAFKALALGATAVCIGRPYIYGLALAGEAGVKEVLSNFMADFDLTLGLAGGTAARDIGAHNLVSMT